MIKHKLDGDGRRRSTGNIPDYIDVVAELEAGGQLHLQVTTVTGFAPAADVYIHGTEGTLRLVNEGNGLELYGGQRGDAQMSKIDVPAEKVGSWRVEEEFINAIRGIEPITHTDFTTGVKYMEFTDAIAHSLKLGEKVGLPLS
ncbi:MAG: hypothetical protein HOC77_02000 [Chloroflexi bacterium]|nr:hypothetical protein [Chloroflexota bacterium]